MDGASRVMKIEEIGCLNDIHYNNRWKMMELALGILHMAGFEEFLQTTPIKPKWDDIHRFVREHEKEFRAVFGGKKMSWSEDFGGKEKAALAMFINHKIEHVFGVRFKTNSNQRLVYSIECQFKNMEDILLGD